jgi:hypothetical protein
MQPLSPRQVKVCTLHLYAHVMRTSNWVFSREDIQLYVGRNYHKRSGGRVTNHSGANRHTKPSWADTTPLVHRLGLHVGSTSLSSSIFLGPLHSYKEREIMDFFSPTFPQTLSIHITSFTPWGIFSIYQNAGSRRTLTPCC